MQGAGYDGMGYEEAREIVKDNIEYDILVQDPRQDKEQLDEVVELIAETLCSRRQTIVVAGDEYRNTAIPSFPRTWHGASATPEGAAHGRSAT